jgi:hypothetical protein
MDDGRAPGGVEADEVLVALLERPVTDFADGASGRTHGLER